MKHVVSRLQELYSPNRLSATTGSISIISTCSNTEPSRERGSWMNFKVNLTFPLKLLQMVKAKNKNNLSIRYERTMPSSANLTGIPYRLHVLIIMKIVIRYRNNLLVVQVLITRLQLLNGWLRYNCLRLVAEGHTLIPTPPGVFNVSVIKTNAFSSAIYIIKTSVCRKRWILYVVRYRRHPGASRDFPGCPSA